MNQFIRLLFLFFICSIPGGQLMSQTWDWAAQFGDDGNEIISGFEIGSAGNYLMAGGYSESMEIADTTLESIGLADVFLSKLNNNGEAQWAVSGGSVNIDVTAGISIDTSANIIWCGQFWVQGYFGPDTIYAQSSSKAIFVTKYDDLGNYIWSKSISGSAIKVINDVATDLDNNIYLTGYFEDSLLLEDTVLIAPLDQNFFILKFDPDGNLAWGKSYGTFGTIRGNCLEVDIDGDIVVGGHFQGAVDFDGFMLQSNNIDFDIFVVKFNQQGTAIWAKEALGIYDDICSSIAIDSQNNVYLSGNFIGEMSLGDGIQISTPGFKENLFLLKYESTGSPLWARGLDSQQFNDYSFSLDIEVCDNYVGMTGYFEEELKIDEYAIFAQSDGFNGFVATFKKEDGTANWLQLIGGSDYLISSQIVINETQQLSVGGYFLEEAYFDDNTLVSNGFNDVFVSKLKEISTSNQETELKDLNIEIYPNPSGDFINISIEQDIFFIKIYDLHGRLVSLTENEKTIDISGLISGNYFLKIGNSFFEKSVLITKL